MPALNQWLVWVNPSKSQPVRRRVSYSCLSLLILDVGLLIKRLNVNCGSCTCTSTSTRSQKWFIKCSFVNNNSTLSHSKFFRFRDFSNLWQLQLRNDRQSSVIFLKPSQLKLCSNSNQILYERAHSWKFLCNLPQINHWNDNDIRNNTITFQNVDLLILPQRRFSLIDLSS